LNPPFGPNEPVDDALSLLDDALREDGPAPCGDDHTDEVLLLLEELGYVR